MEIPRDRDGSFTPTLVSLYAGGADVDGIKHVLGIWVQEREDAKFWARICAELGNSGVKDILAAADP